MIYFYLFITDQTFDCEGAKRGNRKFLIFNYLLIYTFLNN